MRTTPRRSKIYSLQLPNRKVRLLPSTHGAVNSQQEWVNFTDTMLGELNWESTVAYSDDLSTFSPDFETHLIHLRQLFVRLRDHNVRISPKKMQLARSEVSYVGLIVNEHGVKTDPKSIDAIAKMELPATLKGLRRWLGVTGWWRKFIRHYARITDPLRTLLQKGKFTADFTPKQIEALKKLRTARTTAPILAHPRWDRPFTIFSDGSPTGVGAVLTQKNDDGHLCAIAYFSKSLTEAQQGYSQCDIETLALLASLEVWAPYFSGSTVQCVVDCESLKYLLQPSSTLDANSGGYSGFRRLTLT